MQTPQVHLSAGPNFSRKSPNCLAYVSRIKVFIELILDRIY